MGLIQRRPTGLNHSIIGDPLAIHGLLPVMSWVTHGRSMGNYYYDVMGHPWATSMMLWFTHGQLSLCHGSPMGDQ